VKSVYGIMAEDFGCANALNKGTKQVEVLEVWFPTDAAVAAGKGAQCGSLRWRHIKCT
jgi:hypothetical protein